MRKKIILASSFLLAVPLVAYEGGESLACEGQMQVDFAVVSGLKGALLGFLSNVFVSSWSDVLVANLMGGGNKFPVAERYRVGGRDTRQRVAAEKISTRCSVDSKLYLARIPCWHHVRARHQSSISGGVGTCCVAKRASSSS